MNNDYDLDIHERITQVEAILADLLRTQVLCKAQLMKLKEEQERLDKERQ